jgi:glycosyltransferase involved in cell wall biosynthesis
VRKPIPRRPPSRLRTRLLSVGPIPPEWGGRLRGGVTRFHATLLDELRRHPWRHRVEPVGVLIPPPQRVKRWRAERQAPLPVFMQPERGRPRRFTRLLVERTSPDVILLNNVAAFNGARFARVRGEAAPDLPAVGVVHEWRAIRAKRGEERDRYLEAARLALGALQAVVFPSAHTLELGAGELGLRYPERAEVIPNPLQPAFADPGIDVGGARRGIVYVGSFNSRKNVAALVAALAALPADTELLLHGRGSLEAELRAQVDELGLGGRVRFAPFAEGPGHVRAIVESMRKAELVCLPSLSESFGLVLIEALATGTPVAGFGPTLREIRARIGLDCGEPLDHPTPENVAAAIERIRSRGWQHRRLRAATLAEFSAASVARRYARLLREVAAGR